jgi:hypothetical protein
LLCLNEESQNAFLAQSSLRVPEGIGMPFWQFISSLPLLMFGRYVAVFAHLMVPY